MQQIDGKQQRQLYHEKKQIYRRHNDQTLVPITNFQSQLITYHNANKKQFISQANQCLQNHHVSSQVFEPSMLSVSQQNKLEINQHDHDTSKISPLQSSEPLKSSKLTISEIFSISISNQNPKDYQGNSKQTILEAYSSTIKFLSDPKIQNNTLDSAYDQVNFLKIAQCPICYLQYNDTNRKPMKICEQELHVLCSQCYNKEPNINNNSRCYICRRPVDEKNIKFHRDIMEWIRINKIYDIKYPSSLVTIPPQLHQSLRKISIYHFNELDYQRILERKQSLLRSITRLEIQNAQLQNQACQKKADLEQLQSKLTSFERKISHFRSMGNFYSKHTFQDEKTIFEGISSVREQIQPYIQKVQKYLQKQEKIAQKVYEHQYKEHNQKLVERKLQIDDYYYDIRKGEYRMTSLGKSNQCHHCQDLMKESEKKIDYLAQKRSVYLFSIIDCLSKNLMWVLKAFQMFVPRSNQEFNEWRNKRGHSMEKEEKLLIEKNHEQEFLLENVKELWEKINKGSSSK